MASILRAWLDQCPEDFQEPPDYPCLHRLLDYLGRALPGSESLRRAEALLEQLQAQAGTDETEGSLAQVQRSTLHFTTSVLNFSFKCRVYLKSTVYLLSGAFNGSSSFCQAEEEEVVVEIQEDFLSFDADLVAEQLTYMDAVRWILNGAESAGGAVEQDAKGH